MGKIGYYEMSAIGTVMEGLAEIAKANKAPAAKETVIGRQAVKKEFHSEETVAGVDLESYLKREPDDADTFVKVVYHDEWVEKVPVPPEPPTPEVLAIRETSQAKREELKQKARVALTGLGIVVAGAVGIYAARANANAKFLAARAAYAASTPNLSVETLKKGS